MITPSSLSSLRAAVSATVLTEDPNPDELKIQIEGALPIAGLFVLVLSGALFLLWLSMRKQFTKIDPSLPAGRDTRNRPSTVSSPRTPSRRATTRRTTRPTGSRMLRLALTPRWLVALLVLRPLRRGGRRPRSLAMGPHAVDPRGGAGRGVPADPGAERVRRGRRLRR